MPFDEPEVPQENLMELRDRVADCVERLPGRLKWVVNGIVNEGKSLQDIADELSFTKTHIWRLRNQAFEQLKEMMMTDTVIRKQIRAAETWSQSAAQWVIYLTSQESQHVYEEKDIDGDSISETLDSMEAYMDAITDIVENNTPTVNLELLYQRLACSSIYILRNAGKWDSGVMLSLLCSKQHDYGNTAITRFGQFGVVVRLYDKVARYRNLYTKNAANESTYDTLIDIVGYCVIALMLMDETFNLELGDHVGNITAEPTAHIG